MKDFLADLSALDGRVEHAATLEWTDPEADPGPFITKVRDIMSERLAEMRSSNTSAP